jgi:hypothetical protein
MLRPVCLIHPCPKGQGTVKETIVLKDEGYQEVLNGKKGTVLAYGSGRYPIPTRRHNCVARDGGSRLAIDGLLMINKVEAVEAA